MGKRKKRETPPGFLEAYKRVRKPMPPPERVIGDKRRRMGDEEARREIEERGSEASDPPGPPAPPEPTGDA
ncbi:MAG TPA: hypothetical protein VF984_03245 [Actinomycetota bacterium]